MITNPRRLLNPPRIEVRCCCDAHLIGYIEGTQWKEYERYAFPLGTDTLPANTDKVQTLLDTTQALLFEAATWYQKGAPIVYKMIEVTSFLSVVFPTHSGGHLALKSNDYPLEQVRQIQGFHEPTAAEATLDRAYHNATVSDHPTP